MSLPLDTRDKAAELKAHLPDIEGQIDWLDQAFPSIAKVLLEDGLVELAEDWASGAQAAEEESGECYVMEDGQKVFLPITEKAFCRSLYMDGISLSFEEGWDRPSMELYIGCSPDYFAGHCMVVAADGEHRLSCGGLAG